ncbi:MAG TPA: hypothetical protein VK116_08790, partial [Planctomycetota bacterium]|nr:hypothetical protein [Planctomycetota bacterium]
VRFAAGAGVDAFLWECMGLTPSYVQILQKQWMRDDLSTITNTYPDHEDLQGPAGIDIPHVMCEFIPRDGYLFTTEEQMLPILRQGARSASTVLETASWLEAGLLTNDVLERFPYDEHPYNIALVLELARELGVEKDFALKAMADRVVADLGVLKTYPPARVRDRIVEFVNGMSANERHGALGNWTRLGFDKEDALENADTWIVTVINNRADRIARSRVFADMVVRDVSADRHVLIGNNLLGLQGYIKEAWDAWIASVDLFEKGEDGRPARDPITIVEENVKRHRLPLETSHIARRLQAMLRGLSSRLADGDLEALIEKPDELREKLTSEELGRVVEEILEWLDDMKTLVSELDALRGKLRGGARGGALEEEFRDFLWRWYRWKIIVVEDYFATGEEVVERVARSVPPGLRGRVLGM